MGLQNPDPQFKSGWRLQIKSSHVGWGLFILSRIPTKSAYGRREAKENIIFFVAQSSTLLSSALAEGPQGLSAPRGALSTQLGTPN